MSITTALSTLRERLSIMTGDYLTDTVTTALTTSTALICTNLAKYTGDANYFKNWYVLITSGTNIGACRKISTSTAAGTLTVYSAFVVETPTATYKATFELHKIDPTQKTRAINNAARELYPTYLHRRVVDENIVTGNIMPPFIWDSTSTLAIYTEPTGTLTKTTSTYLRGNITSAYVDATGADDGIVLDSNVYPRLLDLMDNTVSLKCWVLPEVANDAFLDIITTSSAGADTTQSSTTTCSTGVFTLLAIDDYSIPDDITRFRAKLRVHTTLKYVYFAFPRLTGGGIYEYILPQDFQNGHVTQVWIQTSSYSDDACDDLKPYFGEEVFGWNIVTNDDGYRYIKLPYLSTERKLRLVGEAPLEDTLSSDTDTMTIEGERVNLLLAYAAYLLYEMQRGVASGQSVDRYNQEIAYWGGKVERLKRTQKMTRPSGQIRWS